MGKGFKSTTIYSRYFREPKVTNNFGLLSEDEMQYILAISDVIYFASNEAEAKQLHKIVREWTERSTKMFGKLEVYQQGIATLKMVSSNEGYNAPFYDLPALERQKVIDKVDCLFSNMLDRPDFRNPFTILKFVLNSIINHRKKQQIYFLRMLKKDLVIGIFSSNLGWRVVGNHSKPGVAGNYQDYTEPPDINISEA